MLVYISILLISIRPLVEEIEVSPIKLLITKLPFPILNTFVFNKYTLKERILKDAQRI